jgi:hypothetical protein
MDFVHDQLASGRKLRVLTIIDTFSRFSPAIEPRLTFVAAVGFIRLFCDGRHILLNRLRASFPQNCRSGGPAVAFLGLVLAALRSNI